ncbi:substrate-binding domain-containing protein [uncultured Paenibacillus sp.]|uniref:substrate-binding domain-containing protein n=1 Tax=uncultured Paenibacillus sp. TaxID=227322 RepID=UPI0028D64DEA|nr:substrate-binding domain-containing protein [uncultured Paenibacillus sp.]
MKNVNRSKMMVAVSLVLLLVFVAACGNNAANSPASDNTSADDTASAGGAANAGGTGNAASAEAPIKIDYGPYCGDECKQALALGKDPASYEGKVGFAVASLTFGYGVALKAQTEEHAKKYFPNIELLVGDGQNDPVIQTSVVDDFISKGIDVLIINAVEKDALAPVVKKAMDAGIKVISVDRTVNTPVTTTIKGNDIDLGTNAGGSLVEVMGGKGNVIELQGSASASPTIDRHQGLVNAIEGTEIKVIASQYANYDQATALKVMEDLLQRFPSGEIDAVFTHADMMSEGALQAIRAAGREDEIKIVSIDGQESALDWVAAGAFESTTVYPVVSPMGIIAAAKAIAGEQLPEFVKLETPTVTKDTAAQFKGTTFK